ncbi:hypothetical protein [Sorangium sp. So ce1151]|uniref:hypothetical protein n=1 Tax=Sorangium sp. So ce1151 TaxID=3133332 RepID=UPI003F6340E4
MASMDDAARAEQQRRAVDNAVQGESLRLSGNYSQAIRFFSAAIKAKANYSWAYAHRAAARAALGNFAGAYGDFEEARKDYQNNNQFAWFLGQKAELFRLWARATLMGGAHAHAESDDWRNDKDVQSAPVDLGNAGNALRKKAHPVSNAFRQMDFAIQLFSKAHDRLGSNPWILAHRGATYTMRYWVGHPEHLFERATDDDFNRGEEDFKAACALNSGYGWAYAFHAVLAGLHGDLEPAFNLIGKASMNGLDRNLSMMRIIMALATHKAVKAGGAGDAVEAGDVVKVDDAGKATGGDAHQSSPFETAVDYAWKTLQIDSEEAFARYYVAVNVNRMPHSEDADAKHTIRRARTELRGLQARLNAMEGSLDCLEENPDGALERLKSLEDNFDLEALSLIDREPVWAIARAPVMEGVSPGLNALREQYRRLFNLKDDAYHQPK